MASGYVKEYDRTMPLANGDEIGLMAAVPKLKETVTFTTTTQGSAFTYQWITIRTDVAALVAFGSNPTADATGDYLEANKVYLFKVDVDDKLALVTA